MKCEWVQQNIVLYVYDELPDDARHELEQHVARCATCMAELSSVKSFRSGMTQLPVQEPTPTFLTASRMKLQEALESAEQGGWWSRLVFDPVNWLNQVRFAPALAAAIFIVGFAGGIGATYKMVRGNSAVESPITTGASPAALSSISGISSVSAAAGIGPGHDQVRHSVAAGSTRISRRFQYPAAIALRCPQQLQRWRSHGFHEPADPAAQ